MKLGVFRESGEKMASRMKEDEKNERTIRGLLKLPANRRCINCNNMGPQYVCTNFWTFVCTNCGGIHREFTHRVKSVSMAKFTSQEVISLQEGGNERAKEIYFKDWDPQQHSFPDSSNIDRLRDFIKHVYVDRRYSGERNSDRPARVKMGDMEGLNENRRGDSYKGGSRSPPNDDRYSERSIYGGRNESRSPGYDADYKRSPGRFEVANDSWQDDRFGSGNQNWKFEDRKLPDGIPKSEGRSPNCQNDIAASSPPMIRPVRDILGDDMPTLRVGDPPKLNGARILENSAQTQRSSSSSNLGPTDGTPAKLKRVNSGSLIDFNVDAEPPAPETSQQGIPHQTTSAPADGGNWASFDIVGQQKTPQPPQAVANANTLESALGQLSVPKSGHGLNMSNLPVSSVDSFPQANNGSPTMQQQPPTTFPSLNNQFRNPQFSASTTGSVNQLWGSSVAPNSQVPLTAPAGYPPQVVPRLLQENSSGVFSQPPADAKPSGRKELPQDIFTSIYPPVFTSASGWQRGPHVGIGYSMQYPAGMMMPAHPHVSNSSNPFDLINVPASVQSPMFPSMASLQGALSTMTGPAPLLNTSSFGTPSPQWIPPQQPSYPPATSQSPYMMQQVLNNTPQQISNNMIPPLHQGIVGPGIGVPFGSTGMNQYSGARFSQPGTPNSFGPVGGNPFG